MDFCWLLLSSWCSTCPSPLNNSHWLQNQLLQKQEQWGLKGLAGINRDSLRCQSSQLTCSQKPPSADFYQGCGVAQEVRVSIWEGCVSTALIVLRFLRLPQVSVCPSEFDEQGKPYHYKAVDATFPTELICLWILQFCNFKNYFFFGEGKKWP